MRIIDHLRSSWPWQYLWVNRFNQDFNSSIHECLHFTHRSHHHSPLLLLEGSALLFRGEHILLWRGKVEDTESEKLSLKLVVLKRYSTGKVNVGVPLRYDCYGYHKLSILGVWVHTRKYWSLLLLYYFLNSLNTSSRQNTTILWFGSTAVKIFRC